jgi:hypothetical protein
MKKPDLLILIAVWQFITAFVELGLGFSFIAIFALPDFSGSGQSFDSMGWQDQMGMTVFILLWLCFMALSVAGGIGLLLKRGRKWVRTVSIASNVISLFLPPVVGTIIGILTLFYLNRQDVRDYFNPPQPKLDGVAGQRPAHPGTKYPNVLS